MVITSKLEIDLHRPVFPAVVNAVQGDQNTRCLEISLYSGGVAFKLPEGTTAAMRYGKPDNTKGLYDTMPDGSSAFSVSGNTVTILLAPQMLTVPGSVLAQAVLMNGESILSTFTVQVHVEEDPSAGVLKSEDYSNWLGWIKEELDAYLEKLKVNGEFVGGTVVGAVNMNGQSLYGLKYPTSPNEAASKQFVEDCVSNAGGGSGTVTSVAGVSPDATGNVALTASDVDALSIRGGTMEGSINMNGQKLTGLNDPTADDEAATRKFVETYVAENGGNDDLKPKAGFIYPLASAMVPEGFLLCDGAAYARAEYPELFAAIGTMYGEGDGSSTFNVPDLATRVPVGAGETYKLGDVGGEETHTLTEAEMPKHRHDAPIAFNHNGSNRAPDGSWTDNAPDATSSASLTSYAGNSQPHNNMQPYTVVNYIIATGKNTGVSVADIIIGSHAIPLGVEYGGTGATNVEDARKNLGLNDTFNHIDNSDFTQFVAQAGIGGKHGNHAYAGDRWILDSGTVTGNTNANGSGYSNIQLTGTIRQIIANPPSVGSVFVEMVSGTATATYQNGEVIITSNGGVIRNVLLCKGEYTEANKPKYQPKGYGAELTECRRYCRKYNNIFIAGRTYNPGNGYKFSHNVYYDRMRVVPSIVATLKASYATYSGFSTEVKYDCVSFELKSSNTASSSDIAAAFDFDLWADFPED